MADVKWIKIITDIFDDEKILLIENLPDADTLIVIWFKLLCLAGKTNNNGVFLLSGKMPYTDEMLATIFRRPLTSVRFALEKFEELGMIETYENVITIPNWGKHQTLDKLEKKTNYMREYMRGYRQKQKEIACKSNVKDLCKTNVKKSSKTNVRNLRKANVSSLDIDKDKDKDKESDIDKIDMIQNNQSSIIIDTQKIMNEWNQLIEHGIQPVRIIGPRTNREAKLKYCIEHFGAGSFSEIIEQIKKSDYLQGKADRTSPVDFDWIIDYENYGKVLEGFYRNKDKRKQKNRNFIDLEQREYPDYDELEKKLLDN